MGDSIASYRDLRKSPGISYYGAKNLQHYIYYKEQPDVRDLYFDYQMKYNDSPYGDSEKEMYLESMIRYENATPAIKRQSYWGYFNMESDRASMMNKLRMRYKNNFKAGIIYETPKGSTPIFDSSSEHLFNDGKFYVGYENNLNLLGNNYIKLYAGNFRATFGEGLVMENTDSYSPRKTGYGFNKRITGVIGDISRTQERCFNLLLST